MQFKEGNREQREELQRIVEYVDRTTKSLRQLLSLKSVVEIVIGSVPEVSTSTPAAASKTNPQIWKKYYLRPGWNSPLVEYWEKGHSLLFFAVLTPADAWRRRLSAFPSPLEVERRPKHFQAHPTQRQSNKNCHCSNGKAVRHAPRCALCAGKFLDSNERTDLQRPVKFDSAALWDSRPRSDMARKKALLD